MPPQWRPSWAPAGAAKQAHGGVALPEVKAARVMVEVDGDMAVVAAAELVVRVRVVEVMGRAARVAEA